MSTKRKAGSSREPGLREEGELATGPSPKVNGMTHAPALTTQMLEWLDKHPRSYSETLEAWKTSCPRLSIWEDALADGLIRIEAGRVRLTHSGRGLLLQR